MNWPKFKLFMADFTFFPRETVIRIKSERVNLPSGVKDSNKKLTGVLPFPHYTKNYEKWIIMTCKACYTTWVGGVQIVLTVGEA